MAGQVDSDGVGVEQGDEEGEDGEDGEGVVVEHGDEGELGVVGGPGDDEVGVVVEWSKVTKICNILMFGFYWDCRI